MNSVSYYHLTGAEHDKFCQFLKDASVENDKPAALNMWAQQPDDKNTLLYLLDHTDRFSKNGMYQVLFDNGTVVACSGAYTSEFSKEVAILGVRTWVHASHRNKLIARNFLLPIEKQWAVNRSHKAVMLTFNEYNRNLLNLFLRKRAGMSVPARDTKHFGHSGIHTVDHAINVQYTKQYAIYEKLDPDFCFDWESIKYTAQDIVDATNGH